MFSDIQVKVQRWLRKYDVVLSESTVSMILGALVVLVVGLLAYNYFRIQRETANVTPAEVSTSADQNSDTGDINGAKMAVALPTSHTVADGESLWSIAQKYYNSGYNWVDIAAVNQLWNPNYVMVGQKLTIPKVEVRQVLGTGGPAIYPAVTDSRIEGASYVVMKGDDLWSIAIRAYGDGFKWVEIAKANNLFNPNLIHAGNSLAIPR